MSPKNLLPFLFLFIACRAVHKTQTTTYKKTDSIYFFHSDTSNIRKAEERNKNIFANGIHIDVKYDTNETALNDSVGWKEYWDSSTKSSHSDQYTDLIKKAIGYTGTTGRIQSISISVDSFRSTDATKSSYDSGGAVKSVSTRVGKVDSVAVNIVDKKPISMPALIGWGVLGLFGLFIVIVSVKKIIKWQISK